MHTHEVLRFSCTHTAIQDVEFERSLRATIGGIAALREVEGLCVCCRCSRVSLSLEDVYVEEHGTQASRKGRPTRRTAAVLFVVVVCTAVRTVGGGNLSIKSQPGHRKTHRPTQTDCTLVKQQ